MILEIRRVLAQLVGDRPKCSRITIARIETTCPVYLVFDGDHSAPRWAVRFGTESALLRTHSVLQVLSTAATGLVPRPIACERWHSDVWVRVEEAVDGVPWFTLRDRIQTANDWRSLKDAAVDALTSLHAAIRTSAGWFAQTDVEAELGRCVIELEEQAGLGRMKERLNATRDALRATPTPSVCQHGDFCLNNLLFTPSHATIIDFEEFGLTTTPLHDEFGLALSFETMVPSQFGETLADHLAMCLRRPLEFAPRLAEQLEGLFLIHLLTRLRMCRGIGRRAALAASLRQQLVRFTAAPEALFTRTRQEMCAAAR